MSRDALVVGVNVYQNESLKNLTSPAADAEAIAQMLEKHGDFDVVRRLPEAIDDENKPVVGQSLEVRLKELKQALVQLFKPEGKHIPDTALFYFSGHGLRNTLGISEGFLATSDTHPDFEFYGLSMNWLRQLLEESPIRQQVIWLDCCHSGQLLIHEANPGNNGFAKDRCFIASSREFEGSWSDLNSSYSVMTKALLDGLDPNRLPGRWVDTFALTDYVNQTLKGELQTPICTNFGEAINLTRSWQVEAEQKSGAQTDSGICPYKGLEFFDCNDEDPKYFFGRDVLVDELLDKVRTSNFMALVGASGNGKSSVLRAGLLHQLKLGRRITGSDSWQIRITRPDKNPLENLALAFVDEGLSDLDRAAELGKAKGLLEEGTEGLKRLIQVSSAPRIILVVDQIEEVFTRCESAEEREQYLKLFDGGFGGNGSKALSDYCDAGGFCWEMSRA
ncbi:caspase family protein [[Leptolyngbya] sp. PCC 7376]|uniref:nSTAND1 domain-containing NTPase n=1 Tax=[Leptolyngbya] sp. PCC 7376 TaxID=111781 RepID=UPI0002DD82DD|nr:caspase family protein [[Leptolyngbya] sp. PCC 7376]